MSSTSLETLATPATPLQRRTEHEAAARPGMTYPSTSRADVLRIWDAIGDDALPEGAWIEAVNGVYGIYVHGELLDIVRTDGGQWTIQKKVEKTIRGKAARDERGLTPQQAIILDLMLRPDGATDKELREAGATNAKTDVAWVYLIRSITRTTKGRFAATGDMKRKGGDGRTRTAYRMRELPENEREAALVNALAEIEAAHQGRKRSGPTTTPTG